MQVRQSEKNIDLVKDLVEEDPGSFKYASTSLRNKKTLACIAIQNDPHSLRWAGDRVTSSRKLAKLALSKDGTALKHVCLGLQSDPDIVITAIETCPDAFQYAKGPAREDPNVLQTLATVTEAMPMQDFGQLSYGDKVKGVT